MAKNDSNAKVIHSKKKSVGKALLQCQDELRIVLNFELHCRPETALYNDLQNATAGIVLPFDEKIITKMITRYLKPHICQAGSTLEHSGVRHIYLIPSFTTLILRIFRSVNDERLE